MKAVAPGFAGNRKSLCFVALTVCAGPLLEISNRAIDWFIALFDHPLLSEESSWLR
jgi:hypothetical protein